jgi:PPOX class probable F420-dependent enzyme
VERTEALRRLGAARVGRFASLGPRGAPHIVPVTFAIVDRFVVHMVDYKPKTTTRLQRLKNIEAAPTASLLVDHYDEDWSNLWWVRVDGAVVVEADGDRWERARSALAAKYSRYREMPPNGPAICLAMDKVTYWESGG